MYNNDYMYAIERSDEYLAHYGIRGMKWGVRKAIASGNSKRLGKQYAKAQKKLAKLEKRAANSKKYARRAALLGAGAAAAGGLAAAGTGGVSRALRAGSYGLSKGALGVGTAASKLGGAMAARGIRGGGRLKKFGLAAEQAGLRGSTKLGMASNAVRTWGNSTSISRAAGNAIANAKVPSVVNRGLVKATKRNVFGNGKALERSGITNNTIARIGAGAVGAGLAVGAARNAYKAATAKKKAEKFRSAMNESFKGTQYANGGKPRQGKKRRK